MFAVDVRGAEAGQTLGGGVPVHDPAVGIEQYRGMVLQTLAINIELFLQVPDGPRIASRHGPADKHDRNNDHDKHDAGGSRNQKRAGGPGPLLRRIRALRWKRHIHFQLGQAILDMCGELPAKARFYLCVGLFLSLLLPGFDHLFRKQYSLGAYGVELHKVLMPGGRGFGQCFYVAHEPSHLGRGSADRFFILFFPRKSIAQFRCLKVPEVCAQAVQRLRQRRIDRDRDGFCGQSVIVVVQAVTDAGKAEQTQSKNKDQFFGNAKFHK